jgi:hypothetical protein
VGVSEYEDYNDPRGFVRTNTTLSGPYTLSDVEVLADVRIRLVQKLWFNVRYSYSVFSIRHRDFENPFYHTTWTREQYNNVITFRFTYIFNDIMPDKNRKIIDGPDK